MRAIRYGVNVMNQLDATDKKFQSAVRAIRYGVEWDVYPGDSCMFQSAVRAIRYGAVTEKSEQETLFEFQSAVRAIRYGG